MLITSIDTLERKFKTFCETGNCIVPFDDIIFDDFGDNEFTFQVERWVFTILKRQTWENIQKQFLDIITDYYQMVVKFLDHIDTNIPHESMYVWLSRKNDNILAI